MSRLTFPLSSDSKIDFGQYDRRACFFSVPRDKSLTIHAPLSSFFYLSKYSNDDLAFCFTSFFRPDLPRIPGGYMSPVINQIRIRVPNTSPGVTPESVGLDILERVRHAQVFQRGERARARPMDAGTGTARGIILNSRRELGEEIPDATTGNNTEDVNLDSNEEVQEFVRDHWVPAFHARLDSTAFKEIMIPVNKDFNICTVETAGVGALVNEMSIEIVYSEYPHLRQEHETGAALSKSIYYFDVHQYFMQLSLNNLLTPPVSHLQYPYMNDHDHPMIRQRNWSSRVDTQIEYNPYLIYLEKVGEETVPNRVEFIGGSQNCLLDVPLIDGLIINGAVMELRDRPIYPVGRVANRVGQNAVLHAELNTTIGAAWLVDRGASGTDSITPNSNHASFTWSQIAGTEPESYGARGIIVSTLGTVESGTSGPVPKRINYSFRNNSELFVKDTLEQVQSAINQLVEPVSGNIYNTIPFHGAPVPLQVFLPLYARIKHYQRQSESAAEDVRAGVDMTGATNPFRSIDGILSSLSRRISRHVGSADFLGLLYGIIDEGFREANAEAIKTLGLVAEQLRLHKEGRNVVNQIFADFYDRTAHSTGEHPKITLREFVTAWRRWVLPGPSRGQRDDPEVQQALFTILALWMDKDVCGRRVASISAGTAVEEAALSRIDLEYEDFRGELNSGPLVRLGMELTGNLTADDIEFRLVGDSVLIGIINIAARQRCNNLIKTIALTIKVALGLKKYAVNPSSFDVAALAINVAKLCEAYTRATTERVAASMVTRGLGVAGGVVTIVSAVTQAVDYYNRDDDDAAAWSLIIAYGGYMTILGAAGVVPFLLGAGVLITAIGMIGQAAAADTPIEAILKYTALGKLYHEVVSAENHSHRFLHEDYLTFRDFRLHDLYFSSVFRKIEVLDSSYRGLLSSTVVKTIAIKPSVFRTGSVIRVVPRKLHDDNHWSDLDIIEYRIPPQGDSLIIQEDRARRLVRYVIERGTSNVDEPDTIYLMLHEAFSPDVDDVSQFLVFVSFDAIDNLPPLIRHGGSAPSGPEGALVWWRSAELCAMGELH